MDIPLSVALDQPAAIRDLQFVAGDTFRIVLEAFSGETADVVLANDLSANTLTMLVDEWAGLPTGSSIVGVATGLTTVFTLSPSTIRQYQCFRSRYRIVMDTPAGARTTLCYGNLNQKGGDYSPWLSGNDYGFWLS